MANSVVEQSGNKTYRAWVLGLSFTALAMLGVGVWMASLIVGPAQPWLGPAFLVSMGLAAVVGASKTSSA